MVEVRGTPQAAEDLESVTRFIAQDSPHYAQLFAADVMEVVERIGAFPQSGRMVPERQNPAVRELLLGSYRIVYRLRSDVAESLTIYHGARLLDPKRLT